MQSERAPASQAEKLPGREIENDPAENPCFGCGPDNVDGLRLRFFDDGEVVRSTLKLDHRHASWPGTANMGVVFTALMETGGWAVWERMGPSRLHSPFVFQQHAIATLAPVTIEARIDDANGVAKIDVSALQGGKEVAHGSWSARRSSAEEAKRLLAFPGLPRSLKPGFEDRAAERG
jgi:hypothetical protein